GPRNLFLYLQRHSDADEERLNRKLLALAETCAISITASNDVCHAGTDRRMADVLTCIGLGTTLEEAGRRLWVNGQRHLKAPPKCRRCGGTCRTPFRPRGTSPSAASSH